ncbi:MAG: hypothetical protein KAR64_06810 [Thermoplasmatales archaeon]|nr:hypothetical protein [Thermoplasmatales archaeon]
MNKHLIVSGMAVLLICVGLGGCTESNNSFKSDEDRISGTWVISELYEGSTRTITYIFLPDKTYEVIGTYKEDTESYNGTWEILDYKLVVTIEGQTQTGNYKFSNNDKTLTITDNMSNTTTVLTKQE